MSEIWKPIKFSNKYEISSLGRLRTNIDRFTHKKTDSWFILQGTIDKDGYRRITLTDNQKIKNFSFHRLELMTFKPNQNANKLVVDHINGKRDDNRLENLRWATKKENSKNLHEKKPRYNAKQITDSNGNIFKSYSEASKFYNISPNTVKNKVLRKTKRTCWNVPKVKFDFYIKEN